MSKQAGIKDIAKAAGVSTATVSRTLRNPELVSESTREKVMEAVNASNYRPNQMGISLRTRRTNNIVAIIPDITNPFIASVVRAIEQVAQQHGYNVLLGDTQNDSERIHHYAGMVGSRQADGIILFSHYMPFNHDNSGNLTEVLPPLVNSCEDTNINGIHKVMIDNQAAAITAVNHLLALGHKDIGCITGPLNTDSSIKRLEGYRQALASAGIDYNPDYIIEGDHQMPAGSKGAQILMQLKQRPSAIFCFNDEMAIGAMSEIQEQGYKIPDDISVMGFDDIRFSQYTKPALTTVKQPVEQIGEQCILQLLALIKEETPAQQYINLPVELIVRSSTGPKR